MKNTIDQFMWGYQTHVRASVRYLANRVLERIGAEEETRVDLKNLHLQIGARGRLSFGSPELLEEVWGVRPGAVSPFGAINDPEGRVTVILDPHLVTNELVNFHPLVNTMTTTISSADLIAFLRATGHDPLLIDPHASA